MKPKAEVELSSDDDQEDQPIMAGQSFVKKEVMEVDGESSDDEVVAGEWLMRLGGKCGWRPDPSSASNQGRAARTERHNRG